jgi:hypothetical protein
VIRSSTRRRVVPEGSVESTAEAYGPRLLLSDDVRDLVLPPVVPGDGTS